MPIREQGEWGMKKRFIAALLAFAMAFMLLPATARAAATSVSICGVTLNSATPYYVNGASGAKGTAHAAEPAGGAWNAYFSNGTLSLKGLNVSGSTATQTMSGGGQTIPFRTALYAEGDLAITLTNASSISTAGGTAITSAMFIFGALTVSGTGSLTAEAGAGTQASNGATLLGALTLSSGTLTCTGTTGGIQANTGGVTVNGGTLTASATASNGEAIQGTLTCGTGIAAKGSANASGDPSENYDAAAFNYKWVQAKASAEPMLTVSGAPSGNGNVNVGTAVTLTATPANFATTPSYQWYSYTLYDKSDAAPITGAINATYSPDKNTPGGTNYYCVANGTVTSNIVYVRYDVIVSFTTQPAPETTVREGSITGSLTVEAETTPADVADTMEYFWLQCDASGNTLYQEGSAILVGSGTSLTIPTDLTAGDYYYHCQTLTPANSLSVYSSVAHVKVLAPSTTLAAPTGLAWSGTTAGTASWNAVTNASSYKAQLYKGGTADTNKVGGEAAVLSGTAAAFADVMAANGAGTYYFKVKTVGNGTTYNDSAWSDASAGYSYTPPAVEYDVWVAGTRVTSANASNVLGDGKVSYDNTTGTLTLNNATITATGGTDGIAAERDITIRLAGTNTINVGQYGIAATDGFVERSANPADVDRNLQSNHRADDDRKTDLT